LKEIKEPDYRLGFHNHPKQLSPGEKAFVAQLSAGEELIARREQRPARTDSPTRPPRPQSPFPSGDRRQTTPQAKPRHTPGFQLAVATDLEAALGKNDIDLGIRIDEPAISRRSTFDKFYVCTLLYLEGSPRSREAKERVEECLAAANNQGMSPRWR